MAMKRRMTHIPAMDSVCQLLVELQLGGHLDGVELPGWAIGTSVDEAFKAVRYIGDAEWLEGVYEGHGPQESADRWLEEFLNGKEVLDTEDAGKITGNSGESEDESEDDTAELQHAVSDFLDNIPKDLAARFKKRYEREDGFEAAAVQNMQAVGLALGCSLGADDEQFAAIETEFTFLNPESTGDPDLAVMTTYFLVDSSEAFLDGFDVDSATRAKAGERVKSLVATFKKAIGTTAGAKA
ncbi:hypothetical protein DBR47_12415 [Paucibacter sp. KBW04]|uniref:hypothetical protein n=1 Tax=Paucibacter sp. KBW04 TaxID=2153361 RepID=UPI000F57A46D|nr:hypothetical protein [Paucibacter sp. KBW04]RQO58507.1 hypothetical protein DBR47_12415 [Paucibacter sp. KBW04]